MFTTARNNGKYLRLTLNCLSDDEKKEGTLQRRVFKPSHSERDSLLLVGGDGIIFKKGEKISLLIRPSFMIYNSITVALQPEYDVSLSNLSLFVSHFVQKIFEIEERTTRNRHVNYNYIECECSKDGFPFVRDATKDECKPQEMCSICFDQLNNGDVEDTDVKVSTLFCGHHFHKQCINKWILECRKKNSNTGCPLCRRYVFHCDLCDDTRVLQIESTSRSTSDGDYGIGKYFFHQLYIDNYFYDYSRKKIFAHIVGEDTYG
jgi:hypothetical protein